MVAILINGKRISIEDDPSTPLLWVLRDTLKLKGAKFGCGAGLCGACTVHVNDVAVRSCVTPLSVIEGLAGDGKLHPVQEAWIEEDVPQCGYCQPGQIMQAVDLLRNTPKPTDKDIDAAMAGNLCRCGSYARIQRAIHRAAGILEEG